MNWLPKTTLGAFKPCVILVVIVYFNSCIDSVPEGYQRKEIDLKNDLGSVIVDLPEEFHAKDSLISTSDTFCGDKYLTIIANEQYALFSQSESKHFFKADSLYCFLVAQPVSPECANPEEIDREFISSRIKNLRAKNPSIKILREEVTVINGIKYAVLAAQSPLSSISMANLTATCNINGQQVSFRFECASKNCDGFISRMEKSLNSLQLQPSE